MITAQYVHEASRVLSVDDRIPVEDRSTFALLMTMKQKGWGFEVADDKIKRRASKTPFKHSSNLVWYVVPKATTVDRNYLICLLHLQADAQCKFQEVHHLKQASHYTCLLEDRIFEPKRKRVRVHARFDEGICLEDPSPSPPRERQARRVQSRRIRDQVRKYDLESSKISNRKRLVCVCQGKVKVVAAHKSEDICNRKIVTEGWCSSRQELRMNMTRAIPKSYTIAY